MWHIVHKNMNQNIQNYESPESENSISDDVIDSYTSIQKQRRPQRKTISLEMRKQMFNFFVKGRSDSWIAGEMLLPRSTVWSILSKFRKERILNPKERGGNRSPLFSPEQKKEIIAWIDANSMITLKQLKEKVKDEFKITASISTIDRVIGQFHYTLKALVKVPERRNCETTIRKRKVYSEMFRELETTVPHESIIFLDEVGFSVVTRPKRGRSLKGTSAYCSVSGARSRNISVVAAVNKNGIIYSKIHDKAVTGEDFKLSLEEIKIQCSLNQIPDPIFVMDNAKIHHYKGLQNIIDNLHLKIEYLPPYSPFLNPIENVFSVWKNAVIRRQSKNEAELRTAITECFNDITPHHCDSFYRKMLGYINRSSREEVILE